jgi:hypothetical protein
VYAKSNLRPFTLIGEGFTLLAPRNEGNLLFFFLRLRIHLPQQRFQGLASSPALIRPRLFPLSTPFTLNLDRSILCAHRSLEHPVVHQRTPLESALPRNRRVTALESALPKTLALKSFRIRSSKNRRGRGKLLTTNLLAGKCQKFPAQACPSRSEGQQASACPLGMAGGKAKG